MIYVATMGTLDGLALMIGPDITPGMTAIRDAETITHLLSEEQARHLVELLGGALSGFDRMRDRERYRKKQEAGL